MRSVGDRHFEHYCRVGSFLTQAPEERRNAYFRDP